MRATKPPATIAADCIGARRGFDTLDAAAAIERAGLAPPTAKTDACRRIRQESVRRSGRGTATDKRRRSGLCFDPSVDQEHDQTLISRFERGKVPGLAMRRLYAMLRALRADEITFGPGPRTVPQSSWEDAMYGDLWERAGRVAQARLNRRRSA
jgi:hypothetical protein